MEIVEFPQMLYRGAESACERPENQLTVASLRELGDALDKGYRTHPEEAKGEESNKVYRQRIKDAAKPTEGTIGKFLKRVKGSR